MFALVGFVTGAAVMAASYRYLIHARPSRAGDMIAAAAPIAAVGLPILGLVLEAVLR